MIEIVNSHNQLPVLKKDGRFLSSSYDPLREADQWVKKNHAVLQKATPVIFLGVGGGYALSRAVEGLSSWCVIDSDVRLFEFAQNLNTKISSEHFVELKDFTSPGAQVWQHANLLALHSSAFRVLRVPQGLSSSPKTLLQLEQFLCARDFESFSERLKLYQGLADVIDLQRLRKHTDMYSIQTLRACYKQDCLYPLSPETMIWKLLEELVL